MIQSRPVPKGCALTAESGKRKKPGDSGSRRTNATNTTGSGLARAQQVCLCRCASDGSRTTSALMSWTSDDHSGKRQYSQGYGSGNKSAHHASLVTCVQTPEPTEGGKGWSGLHRVLLCITYTHTHAYIHHAYITRTNTFKKRRQIFGMFDMEKRISKPHLIPCYKKLPFGLFTYHLSSGQPHPSSLRPKSQRTYKTI